MISLNPTNPRNLQIYILIVLLTIFSACNKEDSRILSEENSILSFSLKKSDGSIIDPSLLTIRYNHDSIIITVPATTDVSWLIPEIEISGASISPASGIRQNFTNPVSYTVTAENGIRKNYVVVIKPAIERMIFFGSSDNNFYALNAVTGKLIWKYSGTESFAYSSPTYKDGVIYVGGIDSYVYAFKALTGEIIWKYYTGPTGIESDAVIFGNTVYVGCNDDHLYAINADDGSLKWKFLTGANVSSSPSVYNNLVCFGSSDGNMYALDTSSGQQVWKFQTGGMINQSGACLYNGNLYFGSRDQYFYSIKAQDGTLNWAYPTEVSLEQASPTVVNGTVFMAGWYSVGNWSAKGSVFAIDAASGVLKWEALPNTGFSSSPYVANEILYIGADDLYFYALNSANGETIWRKQILNNSASATVSQGTVYIGGGGTYHFYALDSQTGNEKWKFFIQNGLMTSSPVVIDEFGIAHHGGDSGKQD